MRKNLSALVSIQRRPTQMLQVKLLLDKAAALIGLVAGAPLFLVIAVAIKLDSKGPVLFRPVRIGLGGRPFEMYKLRTMRTDAESMLPQLAHLNLGGPYMIKIPN